VTALGNDIRFSLRSLHKNRSATILAIAALALAIGGATAVFSIIYNVLLKPFPYTDASRLVLFVIHDSARKDQSGRYDYWPSEFLDYSQQSHSFDRIAGTSYDYVVYENGQGAQQFFGSYVTPNLFDFLGVQPLIGRGPGSDEQRSGSTPVFLMGYKMWRSTFGRDPSVLGRSFVLNGTPRVCIGVMPEHFAFWDSELWIPVAMDPSNPEVGRRKFYFIGHLKPGVSTSAAGSDMDVIARHEAQILPKEYPNDFVVRPWTLVERAVGDFHDLFRVLLAAVVLLLLIACANVANLLLAQATARDKEMAIRVSLGASRFRIIRQLMVESLALCTGAAVLGCVLAYVLLTRLVTMVPPRTIPEEAQIHLNLTVLLIGIAITIVTALLCGLAPALRVKRTHVSERLSDSATTHTGRGQGRTRNTLVVVEVAFSIVLLVGGGLLLRSFFMLRSIDVGFDTKRLLAARVPLPKERYKTKPDVNSFFQKLLLRLNSLPGVEAATEVSSLPPYGGFAGEVDIPGKAHSDAWRATLELASADYFRTFNIPFLKGRAFTESEIESQQKVVVINETFRKKFFGNEDPIGRAVNVVQFQKLSDPVADPVFEVIGIVKDFKNQGLEEPVSPEIFAPYTLTSSLPRGILLRTSMNPQALLESVRKEIWAVDPHVMLGSNGSLEEIMNQISFDTPEFGLTLTSAFAMIGLALVAIGVYSVMGYTVLYQTRNIGIRMALGAKPGTVLGMVMRTGFALVLVGIVIGVGMSFGAARLVSSQLKMPALDILTVAAVAGVVFLVAFPACYLPARRATRVDPLIALRHQ
jgi:putative ABC transport system permease protein